MIMKALVDALPWPMGRELLRLMRVDRPIGTWLLLWPSLWALVASRPGVPDWSLMAVFALGAFVMRSAGCVANDLADRHIDPLVARTRERPLAAGRLTVGPALVLLLLLLGIALGIAWTLNAFAVQLCFVGAFLAVSYPFTKRWIHFPQFYMGAAFGWGVIIGWAAATGGLGVEAWLLFLATLFWAAGYDTIYAMMDRPDDLKIGVRSTAILFGRFDRWAVAALYGLAVGLLGVVGVRLGLGWGYFAGLAVCGGQMVWQVVRCGGYEAAVLLRIFLSNNWVGALILFSFFAG